MNEVPATALEFPRDAYLELLHKAQARFDSAEGRDALLSGLDIMGSGAQPLELSAAGSTAVADDLRVPGASSRQLAGSAFIEELVASLADPARLDVALTLARRISTALGPTADAGTLLKTLEDLHVRYRASVLAARAPSEVEPHRQWRGFECAHPYSLTDRFFGRENLLAELDAWLTPQQAATSVWCLSALGGSGKSAVAWHWLNRALPTIRQLGYGGVLWCSFYEKDFDFSEFLRRALAFTSGRRPEDQAHPSQSQIENRLLDVLKWEPFVIVLDGLERLMNGYAIVFDRAIDPEAIQRGKREEELTAHDRRLTDPRSGAFLRKLADELASKILITTRLVPADIEDPRSGHELAHVKVTELEGLDPESATELWRSINPDGEITEELHAVFGLSKYHPLIISVLARSVASLGGDWERWRRLDRHRDFDPAREERDAEIRSHIIGICVRDLEERSYDILGVLATSGKPMPLDLLARILIQGSAAGGDNWWVTDEQVRVEVERLVSLGFVGAAGTANQKEFDVHPVVRGAVWNLITDPKLERILNHSRSEFFATPDRQEEGLDLNKATWLFQLLLKSNELDRAWDMYLNKLWLPLNSRGDNRTLLDLIELMLPQRDPLQLVPLRSRREQGNAAQAVGSLHMSAGRGDTSDRLFRWCGTIRLQSGDFTGFLDARHSRSWQTMYEGRLFETEFDLRGIRIDAMHFRAPDILPFIDCWIGIVLALRGQREEAARQFEKAADRTPSYRWWAQGLAEGYVYLNEPDQALQWLERAASVSLHPTDGPLQETWEQLTRGIARFQKNKHDEALDDLSKALEVALRTNYSIIQCFALPYIAEIYLRREQIDIAESRIDEYFRVDPESRYQLTATDAWRVRALCKLKLGDRAAATECASRAYRLAACDGPPFVYREGLQRAVETLKQCSAYVPRAEARLDPNWRQLLHQLAESPASAPEDAADHDALQALSIDKARQLLNQSALMRKASEQDRRWWTEITNEDPSGIDIPLAAAMEISGITLESFRNAYEESEYKSVLVVFHRLNAESIVPSMGRRVAGELDEAARARWLADTAEHEAALAHFLSTDLAQRVAYTFKVHDLDKVGITAFLQDDKRRIGCGRPIWAEAWWSELEKIGQPRETLILAESMALAGIQLEEFVNAIAVGTPRGIAYAFSAIRLQRAIDELKIDAISNTEGWTDVQIFLRLEDVKQKLGWRNASAAARELWTSLEKKERPRLAPVLRVAEELAMRGTRIGTYYDAYLRSGTEDVTANLAFVEYTRLKDQAWNRTPPQRTGSLSADEAPFVFTDTSGWSEEGVKNRLEVLKKKVGYPAAAEAVRAWWASLEDEHPSRMVLRLAEELELRQASLSELYQASIDGATNNIAGSFAYLDFSRAKRQVADRAVARNREGNTHYEHQRYREAVASYEAAIGEQPNNPVFYINLASAWEQVRDIDRAHALQQAVAALERGLNVAHPLEDINKALEAAKRKRRLLEQGALTTASSMNMLTTVAPIAVEVAANLIPMIETDSSPVFLAMPEMRERIGRTTGITVPGVRFRGNETDMPPGSYLFMLDEVPIVMGTVSLDRSLAIVSEDVLNGLGIASEQVVDPATDGDAFWIASSDADRLPVDSVVDVAGYIVRHLDSFLRKNLAQFITLDTVAERLRALPAGSAIAGDAGLLHRFTRVLRALIDEGVPTVAFDALCQAFLDHARAGASMDTILQAMRALPDVIGQLPGRGDGMLLGLSSDIEKLVRDGLYELGDEHLLALAPEPTQEILSAVRSEVGSLPRGTRVVVIAEDALARRYVRKLLELEFPHVPVLAASERDPADTRQIAVTATLD